jgi:hypothetical protein
MTRRLRRRRRWLLEPIVAAAATISLAGLIPFVDKQPASSPWR